jgi:hypothetical protein
VQKLEPDYRKNIAMAQAAAQPTDKTFLERKLKKLAGQF